MAPSWLESQSPEERLRLLQLAVEGTPDGIWVAAFDGQRERLIYANESLSALTGFSREALAGQPLQMLCGCPSDGSDNADLAAALRRGQPFRTELVAYRKGGQPYYQEITVTPVRDAADVVTHFVGVSRDVTDRRRTQDRLAHQALHDALTDLPNRVLFADRLRQAILAAHRDNRGLAVMIIDLDGFKSVNDSYGHRTGDQLLCQLAPRLQRAIRAADTVARIGGDEFALVLPGVASADDVVAIGQKLRRSIRQPFRLDEHRLSISASLGAAIFPQHAGDADALLDMADQAMYEAKRRGIGVAISAR